MTKAVAVGEPTGTGLRGFVGSFTSGLAVMELDEATIAINTPDASTPPASFLALSQDGRVLYAVHGGPEGKVSGFEVSGGAYRLLGTAATGGAHPCHLSLSGRHILVANYGSGSISVHPIADDGSPGERTDLVEHIGSGPHSRRQISAHAHMVLQDRRGEYVYSTDLGTDLVHRYLLDEGTGRLRQTGSVRLAAGSGPRHLAFHPDGRYAFIVGEIDRTVTVLDLAEMRPAMVLSIPDDGFDGECLPSAIHVSEDGRFCYVANRGPDLIAVLRISDDGSTLRLAATVPCGGAHPRDFILVGDWLLCANRDTDTVTVLRRDRHSGMLSPTDKPLAHPSPAAVCFRE